MNIEDIILGLSISVNGLVWGKQLFNKFRKPKEPNISPAVKELLNSFKSDDGWVFKEYDKKNNIVEQYLNEYSQMRFTLDNSCEGLKPYGGIIVPFLHSFTFDEHEALKQSMEEWKLNVLMKERNACYDKILSGEKPKKVVLKNENK